MQPAATAETVAIEALQSTITAKDMMITELKDELVQLREQLKRCEQYRHEKEILQAKFDGEQAKASAELRAVIAERDRLTETVRGLTAAIQADAAARALTARESQSAIEADGEHQSMDAPSVRRGLFARIFRRK